MNDDSEAEVSLGKAGPGRMQMNILLTGFCGTSSEMLVKKSNYKSLLLPSDKVIDSQILLEEISLRAYDSILSFGQKPSIKDKIYLETTARNADSCIRTNFEYNKLKDALESNNIPVRISGNAGTSFCNMLYWNGLKYIYNKCLNTKMIFLHIPFYKNIADSELFCTRVLTAIKNI